MTPLKRKAAMLDRDGTIIQDRDYTNSAADVLLLPGAAEAIALLASAGFPSVVITNQSGIARGMVSYAQYHEVRTRLDSLLQEHGAVLLDTFACPHHPDFTGPCECRKPGVALYERAATAHNLDLAQCVFIGDRTRDVEPATHFGGRGVLIRSGHTSDEDISYARRAGIAIAGSLAEATTLLVEPEA
jgi:histidinol-phosphate phosphatase family protein